MDNSTVTDSVAQKRDTVNGNVRESNTNDKNAGNGSELIKLYIEELNDVNSDGTIKRVYQLQNIESQHPNDRVQEKSLAPSASTADVNTISQLYALVKASDKKSTSKVVNEDGSLKVVYHGRGRNSTIS